MIAMDSTRNAVGILRCDQLRRAVALAALAIHVTLLHATEPSAVVERTLQVGVQQLLETPEGITRVAVGDDTIVGVHLHKSPSTTGAVHLLLTPLRQGKTSLMVWSKRGGAPTHHLLHVRTVAGDGIEHDSLQGHALASLGRSKEAQSTDVSVVHMKSQVVQVDVKVVEVNKNRMQQAGLNLFGVRANSHGFKFGLISPGASAVPAFGGALTSGLVSNAVSPFAEAFGLLMEFTKAGIGLNLSMLEGADMVKVLAEPSLVAISGQSANFLAGGEIPIPMSQGNGSVSIEYKTYGVGLTVSPTVLDNQRIVLKVAPESSELDYANAVTLQSVAVPAITTRRADTTVELGDGESFVIGGLVSQNITSTVNRVPVLSQIPVLGTLFKRQEFSRKDRELVIVVTPRLVKPLAAHVLLDDKLPGAGSEDVAVRSFWGRYFGPSGGDAALPGFSQ
jgi:pilus assembly protein CpaC